MAACDEGAPTEPLADLDAAKVELATSFDALASTAAREGDAERADALRDAARAARLGIRPTEIEVQVKNDKVIYQAIVVGVVRRTSAGEEVLVRSLFAWTGQRPRTAVLYVASRTDLGLFGMADPAPGAQPGPARGMWRDITNSKRWIAKSGSADISVEETGGACPSASTVDPTILCTLTTWDVRVNGSFEPAPDGGETLPIHTNAHRVNGAILSRTN